MADVNREALGYHFHLHRPNRYNTIFEIPCPSGLAPGGQGELFWNKLSDTVLNN